MTNIPECFCPDKQDCDWVFDVSLSYHRKGEKPGPKSKCEWSIEDIPQVLAQMMLQAMISSTNKQGADIYLDWLEQCVNPSGEIGIATDNPVVNNMRAMMKKFT